MGSMANGEAQPMARVDERTQGTGAQAGSRPVLGPGQTALLPC
jgi:hypothetical protein